MESGEGKGESGEGRVESGEWESGEWEMGDGRWETVWSIFNFRFSMVTFDLRFVFLKSTKINENHRRSMNIKLAGFDFHRFSHGCRGFSSMFG